MQVHLIAAGKYHDIDFARLELLKLLAEIPEIRTTPRDVRAEVIPLRSRPSAIGQSQTHTSYLTIARR